MAGSGMASSDWFRRFILPGLALKGVIIGGGYATGRELAEFFLPAGPWGALLAMLLAMLIWSGVAALTFALAQHWHVFDYRSFFQRLLGPAWPVFELAYLLFVILILAVFGAAAGEIGAATFGWPLAAGSLALASAILAATAAGEAGVERLFRFASLSIYGTYLLFIAAAFAKVGDRIAAGLGAEPAITGAWLHGGIAYAAYNIVGAVIILPVLRHLTSRRDAVAAGAIAGPLAMLPAILFLLVMLGFQPEIADQPLPSAFLLDQMALPWLALLFQLMIFVALVESGVGAVHAINERLSGALEARGRPALGTRGRLLAGGLVLAGCMLLAGRIGLVDLIASGYRFLAWLFLAVYIVPLLLLGIPRLRRADLASKPETAA
jgi:uncharacterized membrane protein YkvI